jgi:LDH2 family malate/lactate/ureidoglycolate dehydrogenase
MQGYREVPYARVKPFCEKIFAAYGFSPAESTTITDVLLMADLFGIESHGIQRLVRYHSEIGQGFVDVKAKPEILHETPVSAVIDGHKGMGQLVGRQAMELAIAKAKKTGIGMVSVRNSNHYGIAGYYTEMAVKQDLIGIAMTNTEAICVPTNGKRAMLGTSPIAFAMPADPAPFSFDAATTVVPRGKLEVYNKNGKPLPEGWAMDAAGHPSTDAALVLKNIIEKLGGGIAPLGGVGELNSGYKGYGFAAIVDICCGIFSGGMTSNHVNVLKDQVNICHYVSAIDYGVFGDKKAMRAHLSAFLQELRDTPKADGQSRVYIHGEKERENREKRIKGTVPVNDKTWQEMRDIAADRKVDFDLVSV